MHLFEAKYAPLGVANEAPVKRQQGVLLAWVA
jgi:hypothetical protein